MNAKSRIKQTAAVLSIVLLQTYSVADSSVLLNGTEIDEVNKMLLDHEFESKLIEFEKTLQRHPEYVKSFLNRKFIRNCIKSSEVQPSIVLAQTILETNYGRSIIGNNYFGIKYRYGDAIRHRTTEYVDGKKKRMIERFQCYTDGLESIKAHSDLLVTKYYINITSHYRVELQKLKRYATDPNYINKLTSIIDKYSLSKLDTLKNIYIL